MDLDKFKTLEQLAQALKPYLSGGRNFNGLNVGGVGSPPTAGDIVAADDIQALGAILVGSPSSPLTGAGDLTTADDVRIEGDLTVVGSGLVTNGNSHDHDGGDGNQIGTGGIANNAVDDTKAGNRVPQFYRRRGGSSSNWRRPGTTNYTPGAVRIQGGSVSVSPSSKSVTFPTSFDNTPLIFINQSDRSDPPSLYISSLSSSSFTITTHISTTIHWLAVGPE